MKTYNDEPGEQGKEVSFHEFLKRSGAYQVAKEMGIIINPTHDSAMLKGVRITQYEATLDSFIAKRKIDGLETFESDLQHYYMIWLSDELKVVAHWLSRKSSADKEKPLHSASEQIEINKYKDWIEGQMELGKKVEPEPEKKERSTTILADLIAHKKSAEIVEAFKIQFKGVHGKSLKHLYLAMREFTPPLIPENQQKFHDYCEREFDWKVDSVKSMYKDKILNDTDEQLLNETKATLESIIGNIDNPPG